MENATDISNTEQSTELLEAQAHIWNLLLLFINTTSLKCAVELRIPDIIHNHGRPITLLELVDALPNVERSKTDSLHRLMRTLVHSGIFSLEKIIPNSSSDVDENEEGYVLTPTSRLLVENHPFTMRPCVLSSFEPITLEPSIHLSQWFQAEDHSAFHTAHGMSIWKQREENPMFGQYFNEGMANDTRLIAGVVMEDGRAIFEGLNSLVDVGGGTATFARAVADAFPQIHCTVLDLEAVVGGLEGQRNLKFVVGDMFHYIPPADAVLLKWILHDWSDEESILILKKCKEAITSNKKQGKVIIIDMIVDEKSTKNKFLQTQLFVDMMIMANLNGKERTEKEWAKLFYDAGFKDYKIFPLLGLRSIIEVYL